MFFTHLGDRRKKPQQFRNSIIARHCPEQRVGFVGGCDKTISGRAGNQSRSGCYLAHTFATRFVVEISLSVTRNGG